MNEIERYHLLSNLIDDAILHLYITLSETSRFTPRLKRNEILVRYLKPKIKSSQYKIVKKELKDLVTLGRRPAGNLEAKLIEFRYLRATAPKKKTSLNKLFDLLTILEDEHRLGNQFFNEGESIEPNSIYICEENIDYAFNQAGEQLYPLSLYLALSCVNKAVKVITENHLFNVEIPKVKDSDKVQRIVLLPTNK